MDILANDLISILSIEKAAYNEMLSLSLAKKDMMMKDDISGINGSTAKENKLLSRIRSLENKRAAETEKIANECNMKPEAVSLDFLIENLPKSDSEKLRKVREELKEIIEKLSKSNEVNKVLIDAQLDYIDFCHELMIERNNIGNNYDDGGYVEENARAGVIDRKV